jgi:multiple sugar transport system substrate-binding protein
MVIEKEVIKEVPIEKAVVIEKEVPIEVVKEVPVQVEKVVKETVVVEKVVEKVVVEKVAAPAEKVLLRYGTHSFGEQLPGFLTIMDKFNEEHSDMYVAVEAKPWGQYWQALETQSVAGIAPDLVWSGMMAHVPFIVGDALVDITSYIESDGIDLTEWFGEDRGSLYQGKYYGMPFGVGGVILFYNKSLFDEGGVDYPDGSWNWNDWREAATPLTKDTNGDGLVDQWGLQLGTSFETTLYPLMLSNGGKWSNGMQFTNGEGYWEQPAEPIEWTLGDSPECIEALSWWVENVCDLGLQPRSGEVTLAPGVGDEFAAGVIASTQQGTWRFNRYKHVTAFEWDVAPIPKSPNTDKRMTTYNLMPNWVTSSTKNLDATWELAKWCSMDFAQRILGENKIKFPCLKTAADSYVNAPPDNIGVVPELFEYGWSLATESFPGNLEMFSTLRKELDYAYLCEKPMDQAAKDATQAVNAILAGL